VHLHCSPEQCKYTQVISTFFHTAPSRIRHSGAHVALETAILSEIITCKPSVMVYGLSMNFDRVDEKTAALDTHRPLGPSLAENLHAWFRMEMTYTSNASMNNKT